MSLNRILNFRDVWEWECKNYANFLKYCFEIIFDLSEVIMIYTTIITDQIRRQKKNIELGNMAKDPKEWFKQAE